MQLLQSTPDKGGGASDPGTVNGALLPDGCGTARPVVWEGGRGDSTSYPMVAASGMCPFYRFGASVESRPCRGL